MVDYEIDILNNFQLLSSFSKDRVLPSKIHYYFKLLNRQVVVGTAHGRLGLFDLRGRKPEVPVHAYKGFAGGVRDLFVHPRQPFVFSVSLDRFLRVHSLTSRKLVFKVSANLFSLCVW